MLCIQDLEKIVDADATGRIIAKKCDITNESEVRAVFDWVKADFGRLDVLVNNAGIMRAAFLLGTPHRSISNETAISVLHRVFSIFIQNVFAEREVFGIFVADGDMADFRHTFDVNVLAACQFIRESVKLMKANGSYGHVIVINRYGWTGGNFRDRRKLSKKRK